jgi:BASS family bile acid:Na+ symporter
MTAQQAVGLALQASIILTVFGFGLRTTPSDVLYVVRRPLLLGKSLVAMFVIMPIVAAAMVRLFELRPSVEIALGALAISPIPPLLPRKQQKAGGDAPYALGLMVVIAVLSIVIVPVAVEVSGRYFERPFAMSPGAIAAVALKAAVLPLVAGVAVRRLMPSIAARIAKPVGIIGTTLLAIGALVVLVGALPAMISLTGGGTLAGLAAFVVAGLFVGHWLGGPDEEHRPVLAFATSTRHPAIALAVAKANFPDEPRLGATIMLYLLVSIVIGVLYQVWYKRRIAS